MQTANLLNQISGGERKPQFCSKCGSLKFWFDKFGGGPHCFDCKPWPTMALVASITGDDWNETNVAACKRAGVTFIANEPAPLAIDETTRSRVAQASRGEHDEQCWCEIIPDPANPKQIIERIWFDRREMEIANRIREIEISPAISVCIELPIASPTPPRKRRNKQLRSNS